jgi:hypothetical protein
VRVDEILFLKTLIKFVCFVALAIHLGWSWWLVALLVMIFDVEYTTS